MCALVAGESIANWPRLRRLVRLIGAQGLLEAMGKKKDHFAAIEHERYGTRVSNLVDDFFCVVSLFRYFFASDILAFRKG